jgi:transcriptional regulator with XRE-family HTH domain
MDFSFAERLEQLMRERDLYPSQLAKLTGIRRQRIQEYLTGERQPTAYMIKTIAERLKVSADWLLNIKNRPL